MAFQFTDPDVWYEHYEPASRKKRYEMMMEAIQEPIPTKIIEDFDLGLCLLDTKEDLLGNNLLTEMLEYIQLLQEKQPEFYQKEFYYYDSSLVSYYLFQDEPDKVAEAMTRFMENPAAGIDEMIPVFDKLILSGYTDLVEQVAQKCYMSVAKAPNLIGGAEWDFVHALFGIMGQKAYITMKEGTDPDWDAFMKEAEQYGFRNDPILLNNIQQGLTQPMEGGSAFVIKTKKQKEEKLTILVWEFCRYMFDKKQIDFVCSEHIWDKMLDFWYDRNSAKKSPATFFGFSQAALDEHLAGMIGGFMSMQQANAVGLLWGIPYIYDFLLTKNIIPADVHCEVLEHVSNLKPEVLKALGNGLWKYDFVHRWTPPDCVPDEEFNAESEHFKATIKIQTPLSKKAGNMMSDMMDMFEGALFG